MEIDRLQQLLGMDKSSPFFEIYFNPDIPHELLVYFGFQLLETVPENSLQKKLLLARLINAGYNQRILHEKFGYDIKTMRRWGVLLKRGKTEDICKIADGEGAKRKLTEERQKFIFYLYENNYSEKGCHIIEFIKKEYEKIYEDKISSESLRILFKSKRNPVAEIPVYTPLQYPPVLYHPDRIMSEEIARHFDQLLLYSDPKNTVIREDTCKNTLLPSSVDVYTPLQYPPVLYHPDRVMSEEIARHFELLLLYSEPKNTITREDTCKNTLSLRLVKVEKSKHFPESYTAKKDNYPLTKTFLKGLFSCHHIGILLARTFIDSISSDLGEIRDIARQWVCMILSGCQNIEQGQKLNYQALDLLVGKQISSANHQRETLKRIANRANVRLLFKKNIELLGAGDHSTFLLDPHGIPYTGQLKILLCWLGSKHQTGKGYYLDLIHTPNGEPVFSKIDDNYYDLRQRFHSVIKEFRRILSGDKNRVLTIIIDRAIYDVGFMREVRCEDIHIITWEKNYRKGQWDKLASKLPVSYFHIRKYRNSKEDSYLYEVKYIKRRWEKEVTFAQYVIYLTKPNKDGIELSVICTDYERKPEETLLPILERWLEENDIKYLVNLGLNKITSYGYALYADIAETVTDRNVKNKNLSKLISEKNDLKNKLGKKMLERELYIEKKNDEKEKFELELYCKEDQLQREPQNKQLEKHIRNLNSKIKRIPLDLEKSLQKNANKQMDFRAQIASLEETMRPLCPYVSRLETLIQEEYVKLNFMPKSFMDAIKIISRNIIYELMKIFRPIWNNHRNDHVILRELLSSIGFIQETEKHIYIKLTPSRTFAKKEKQKIFLFLFDISKMVNEKYENKKIIIITLNDL